MSGARHPRPNEAERRRALSAVRRKRRAAGLPVVTIKAAATLDGHMATRTGDSKWITGEKARRHAHRLRAESDAILVGVGTVLADDPQLTVRHVRGNNPLRVVLDTQLRTPESSALVRGAGEIPTLVFHGAQAAARRRQRLLAGGVLLRSVRTVAAGGLSLRAVLRALWQQGVETLLVEGGPRVHGAFVDAGLADRVELFFAPLLLGDADGRSLLAGRPRRRIVEATALSYIKTRRLGRDMLVSGVLTES